MIYGKSYKQEVRLSKEIRAGKALSWPRAPFLCAVLGLAGCTSIPVPRSADLAVQTQRDLAQAVSLRGLPLKQKVAIERESPDALRASLAKELDKEENRVFLAETELLLKQFRVLKNEESLKAVFIRVMGQQVAAYYDPEKKRVAYVEAGRGTNAAAFAGMERFVYVHEFCHAVEDGHFDLERLTRDSQSTFDRSLALTSLVEGDAMLVGLDGVFAGMPMNTATPAGGLAVKVMGRLDFDDAQNKMMEGCPAFLDGALLRPYLDGAVFANRIRREAGWQAVDNVYSSRLPMTTAEILYPERRYLRTFKPAGFEPPLALFGAARQGVVTNSLGALGTALWFGGEQSATARQFGFLKGWLGDCIYLIKGEHGEVTTVWLTYLERPAQASAFVSQVERRLRDGFGQQPWRVTRKGRLVAAVWTSAASVTPEALGDLEACALQTRVVADTPSLIGSWSYDIPWPIRFPVYDGYSAGFELVGGYAADFEEGHGFFRFNLASGLLLRAESNPDRHYVGTLFGLLQHVEDRRSNFTYWRLPLVASWYRQGSCDARQYKWSALWGLLAYGCDDQARVLFIPVWRRHK